MNTHENKRTILITGADGFKRGIAETAEWFEQSGNLRSYNADVYTV